jgi:hypothetical protein
MSETTSLSVLVPVYNEEYLVAASLERPKLLAESDLLVSKAGFEAEQVPTHTAVAVGCAESAQTS